MDNTTGNSNRGLAAYRLSRVAADEGSWVDLKGGIRVCVRYENSRRVQEATRRIDKKYRTILMTEGGLPADIQAKRDAELIVGDILTNWEGEGLPVGQDFTPKNVESILLDQEYEDLRRDIIYACRMSENFRQQEQLKLTGNS